MDKEEIDKLKQAGRIAKETVDYARSLVKADMSLLEIAEKIEEKIISLGGKPAFPVTLSINEVAAHATPSYNDPEKAKGLIKVDIGVHVDGYAADTAFSLDLENSDENKKLIQTAEKALEKALETAKEKKKVKFREIGKAIAAEAENSKVQPVRNLCGHSIEKNNLHAGLSIPNYDNAQEKILDPGVYAIEPFITTGLGMVRDGKPSGIYSLTKEGNIRDPFAREVLKHIKLTYNTLPFCSRWLYKKFGTRALVALQRIEEAGLVHHYTQLIEKSGSKVAQAEHTIIITDKEVIITTL